MPDEENSAVKTTSKQVYCDGGTLGHPKIYLDMGNKNQITCPYCSRKFVFIQDKD